MTRVRAGGLLGVRQVPPRMLHLTCVHRLVHTPSGLVLACALTHLSARRATQPEGGTNVLCSGSLDGIVRLWDFRMKQSVANFILGGHQDGSMQLGQGASGLKVRDLRVCGAQPWKLAAGMESNNEGDVVVWDLRSNIKPIFRKREETAVHAVDWHPEHPSILATGRTATHYAPGGIKVWDLNMASTGADLLPIAKIITPGMPPRGCMIRVRMLNEPCFGWVWGLSVELLTARAACAARWCVQYYVAPNVSDASSRDVFENPRGACVGSDAAHFAAFVTVRAQQACR